MKRWNDHRAAYEAAKQKEDWFIYKLRAAWQAKKPEAIQSALAIAVKNSQLLGIRRNPIAWGSTQAMGFWSSTTNFPMALVRFVCGPASPRSFVRAPCKVK